MGLTCVDLSSVPELEEGDGGKQLPCRRGHSVQSLPKIYLVGGRLARAIPRPEAFVQQNFLLSLPFLP